MCVQARPLNAQWEECYDSPYLCWCCVEIRSCTWLGSTSQGRGAEAESVAPGPAGVFSGCGLEWQAQCLVAGQHGMLSRDAGGS